MGLKDDFYSNYDLHLHVPEGATPKDGPSAGSPIAVALVSTLTGIPVDRTVAMSGEITLHGRILPVGGLKEKLLAADRFGLKTVFVPKDNEPEIREVLSEIDLNLKIIFVSMIEEVLEQALVRSPFTEGKLGAKKVVRKKNVKKDKFSVIPVKTTRPRAKSLQRAR
jgi:ATP-dependent Lon protease